MKLLSKALSEGSFLLDLKAADIESIFHQALNFAFARGVIPTERRAEIESALIQREREAPTAIGHAVAVPHVYDDGLKKPTIIFIRLAKPLNLGAPDGIPTRFVFLLLGPTGSTTEHLDTLATIARLMSDESFRYEVLVARNEQELLAALSSFRERTEPREAPVAAETPESLQYTGRLFGGIWLDIKRRLPHYVSDFLDGLHTKTISSTLFLYFACLAPAVTFGGIMAKLTDNSIGTVEMIVATAICGVIFALFSGTPLIILGGTGPLLIFTGALYVACHQLGVQDYFFEAYAWVGLWTALIMLVLAATDASCLMRYFTRFTDEVFVALISAIFIIKAIQKLAETVTTVYAEGSSSHDEALVPLLLAVGTFAIALFLLRFRRSRYLRPGIREFLADFGPTIALVITTAMAFFWFFDVPLDQLDAPDTIRPTVDRSWFINPLAAPRWIWFASIGPAILAALLVYIDQNITARLINSRDHRLRKGEAYHLDLGIIGLLIGACSLFGLPWLVAATVRSLNHVRSLATTEEVVMPSGDKRERVLHIRETRLSALSIHLLIGLSIFLLPILRLIPMAVLYGLFLFMGVVSIAGNQFFERLSLWLMDRNLYPSTHYIRKVPLSTIHKFTLLQLACLALLGIVEATPLGILFPLFIAMLVPIRFIAGKYFAPEHLEALDAEEEPEEEESEWV